MKYRKKNYKKKYGRRLPRRRLYKKRIFKKTYKNFKRKVVNVVNKMSETKFLTVAGNFN